MKKLCFLFVLFFYTVLKANTPESLYHFLPNFQLHFLFPENFMTGEQEVYKNYKKVTCMTGMSVSYSNNYTASTDFHIVDILLSRQPQLPAQGHQSSYTYMFLHVNTRATSTPSCKNNVFKRFFVVGKSKEVKDQHQYQPKNDFLFTVPATQFKAINFSTSSLFFCGGSWDNRCSEALDVLDKTDFFHWYGSARLSEKKCYRGFCDSVIDTIAQHGIALVLHSKLHIENEEPSLRIFEAAASSAVIISDKNKFVVDNFGDSVFYIDQNDPKEKIAEDIIKYYQWVKEHPEQALQMARRSHQLFLDSFTLEDQLLRLIHVHQETLILDGHPPLPPRAPFLYDFTHLDTKRINAILALLMQKKFEIVNLSETQINLALTLLNPIKAENEENGLSTFQQVLGPKKGKSIEFNVGDHITGFQDLPEGKYQFKWDTIYGLTLILRGNI